MSNADIASFCASFNKRFPQGKAGVVLQGQWRERQMKVNAYKTIDVEFEAEISLADVLRECAQRVDESEEKYFRRLAPAIDWMTRILASIKPEVIAAFPEESRKLVRDRLRAEAERWTLRSMSPQEQIDAMANLLRKKNRGEA